MEREHTRAGGRLAVGLLVAVMAFVGYCQSIETNDFTGERQAVALNPRQEIALGLQAAPKMIARHGGQHPSQADQDRVDRIGQRLVERTPKVRGSVYRFEFHLLADGKTINAFALPGGQCFITWALYQQLETDGQLAGVLGHEMGHVLARHGAQRLAKERLTAGLVGAVGAGADNPQMARQVAAAVGNLINMKYGRDQELESDRLGVELMINAGYDPSGLVGVMKVLEKAGAGGSVEFFSTHPNPDNRIERIEALTRARFPDGVPTGYER